MEHGEKGTWGGKRREGVTRKNKTFSIDLNLLKELEKVKGPGYSINDFINEAITEKLDYPKTDLEIIQKAQQIADETPTAGARLLAIPVNLGPYFVPEANKVWERKDAGMALVHFKNQGNKWVFERLE